MNLQNTIIALKIFINLLLRKISFHTKLNVAKPFNIYFFLNLNCNCRCVMCDLWKIPNQEIPPSLIKNILVKLSRWVPGCRIQFSGGEPLLRKDIFDILALSVSLKFNVGIVTNGFLINPDVAKELMSLGLFNVNISLDSLIPEKNDCVRGIRGAFEMTSRGINNLIEAKKDIKSNTMIIIKTVISKNNINELLGMIDFVKNNKLDGILFQPLQENVGSDQHDEWYKKSNLWITDQKKLNQVIDSIILLKKNTDVILNSRHNLLLMKEYFSDPRKWVKNKCLTAYSNLVIEASGAVSLCTDMGPIGNVYKEYDLSKIWRSNNATMMRKKMNRCKIFCLNTCNEKRTFYEYYNLFKYFFGSKNHI